jgi:hypothetical protein
MNMQENQTDKIIIYPILSVHGDIQENVWVSLILVKVTVMTVLTVDHIVQITIWLRRSSGGHSV